MSVVIDQEKWLRALAEEEPPPVGLLAISSELLDTQAADSRAPVPAPVEKVKALVLTLRVPPGASEEELASVITLLMCQLSWREEEFGGEGLEFDANGSVFGSDRVILRLFPSKREAADQRMAQLVEELNSESHRVAGRAGQTPGGGIAAKIARNLNSPLPESAMKHLEMAAVA